MKKSNVLVGLLCALVTSVAGAHGIMPTRLQAPSGSQVIGYQFKALNFFDRTSTYRVECFRNALAFPVPCLAMPKTFTLRPNAGRNFRVRIDTGKKNGIYYICTAYIPPPEETSVVTRTCARFGVGVNPNDGGRLE